MAAQAAEGRRPYAIDRLVCYEAYDDLRLAIQRERNMKHWPRAWKCNLIVAMNPTWRDLYEDLDGERIVLGIGVAGTSPAMTPEW